GQAAGLKRDLLESQHHSGSTRIVMIEMEVSVRAVLRHRCALRVLQDVRVSLSRSTTVVPGGSQ
ncbi:MAG TPA: hypothetical protein VFO16_13505, partial [Pseudonocardiaceae bacterium]|nr:hypothetical protein [Pseudonocardiaceae bacterium]